MRKKKLVQHSTYLIKNMANLHKVFVYGTLKRGEPNHHWFRKTANAIVNFICEAETNEKYPLIIATKYNIPFLLFQPGTGHKVQGEVYEIDDITLDNLDELEDHPNYYMREQKTVISKSDGTKHEGTWIYFLKNYRTELLEKPMLESYSNKNGLIYTERYLRNPEEDAKSQVHFKKK